MRILTAPFRGLVWLYQRIAFVIGGGKGGAWPT